MKIPPVGAELFHEEGWTGRQTDSYKRTDITKLIVAFCKFANASVNHLNRLSDLTVAAIRSNRRCNAAFSS